MSKITVNFIGVCTHMNWTQTEPHFTRKTVLVNAWNGTQIDQRWIPPHKAELRVLLADVVPPSSPPSERDGDVAIYELRGVLLRIEAAVGDFQYDPSYFTCVPSLEKLTPTIGRPSQTVVDGNLPVDVAAAVLTTAGTMHGGRTVTGAAVAWWAVETSGTDPVALTMIGFDDRLEAIIRVREGSTVTVANIGDKKIDSLDDFLLHYKTAERVPENPGLPSFPPFRCAVIPDHETIPHPVTIGPGCSNSGYP